MKILSDYGIYDNRRNSHSQPEPVSGMVHCLLLHGTGNIPVSCRTYLLLSVLSLAHHNLRYNQKRRCTLSNAQNYLYNFNKFVEHALRLQAQSERKLSLKCINISGYTLNIHLLFSYIIMVITRNTNSAHTTYIIG